jgi:predicted dehydrogenase
MDENKSFDKNQKGSGINRRDLLKGLAGIPVLGALWYSAWEKHAYAQSFGKEFSSIFGIQPAPPPPSGSMDGNVIKIGIIGTGIRGTQLMRATGYASPQWLKTMKESAENNKNDKRYQTFMEQERLNVRFTAISDVYDKNIESAVGAATTDDNKPKVYRNYQDMLADPNVDAVVIATPDHLHAQQAIDAIKAGKHVYLEKCMTHKITETYELEEAVNNSNLVLQVGHQHRQTESFLTAQDIIAKNILGHINLVQCSTNRNDDNGAWQYRIDSEASPNVIDWKRFLGPAPEIPFNAEHFFRWRKWWAYSTGLSGDLLTHEFDSINCILKMGIPARATATGGIYTHRDGREVPDVMQVSLEYPDYYRGSSQEKGKEKGMTFLYSASLGNQFRRPTLLMGHDATIELGAGLTLFADARSTRYKSYLADGTIEAGKPIYSYVSGNRNVDGVTSATAKYFADKGLLYTYRGGRQVDSTHLHVREWLSCIRHGDTPSCGMKEGFEEAISAHMATLSYKTGKVALWDPHSRRIRITGENYSNADLDNIITRGGHLELA